MASSDDASNSTATATPSLAGGAPYDPSAPVPYWHQTMELTTICVANSLTLILIITRVFIRRRNLKRFRADDLWIAAAGLILVFPHWVCQIGTNRYGSGLHSENIPDAWLEPYWRFSWGWVGYYIASSMIKVSICYCLLEILPHSFNRLRLLIYGLCFVIVSLGLTETVLWLFQCQPVMSNFNYAVLPVSCLNIDVARYVWVGLGTLIDVVIVAIPFSIFKQIRFKPHEKYTLMIVFGASLLGTFACLFGIYGIWSNRTSQAYADLPYTDTLFVMTNDIEILMYTLGASATVASRYFVSKAASLPTSTSSIREKLLWRRKSKSNSSSRPSNGMPDLPPFQGHGGVDFIELSDSTGHSRSTLDKGFMAMHHERPAPALNSKPSWLVSDDMDPTLLNSQRQWPLDIESLGVLPDIASDDGTK